IIGLFLAQDLGSGKLRRGVNDLGVARAPVVLQEYAGGSVAHDQHGWEHQGGDVADLSLDGLGFESRPSGSAIVQRDRQSPVGDWQAGQERIAAQCPPMMTRKIKEAIGQWISRITDARIRARSRLGPGSGSCRQVQEYI